MAREVIPVVIANGASVSTSPTGGMSTVGGGRILGLIMPAAWTAADVSFESTLLDSTTWGPVIDKAGTQVKITSPAAASIVALTEGTDLLMLGQFRLRSGTSAVPVAQGAARTLGVVIDRY